MMTVTERAAKDRKGKDPKDAARTDPTIAAAIGKKLRSMYDEMLAEPVPSDLSDLVKRLSGKGSDGG